MIAVTYSEILQAVGGRLLQGADALGKRAKGVSIDTRTLKGGEFFVALRGPHHDAHEFLTQAARKGAAGFLVQSGKLPRGAAFRGLPVIQVKDTTLALGQLAGLVRSRSPARVIGVTGSTGKTLTKDFLASVLRRSHKTVASEKSFNNEVGVPLTLLGIKPSTEMVVLEMGSRGLGHIEQLCSFAKPDAGIVTNVGVTHYQYFKTEENIALAKAELLRAIPPQGICVLNSDEPRYKWLSRRCGGREICFGTSRASQVRGEDLKVNRRGKPSFTLMYNGSRIGIELPLPGRYNLYNALAAAACSLALGLGLEQVKAGLEKARLTEWRMEMFKTSEGVTILNDCYNSNPAAVKAALESLGDIEASGKLIVVLGDMAELGAISEEAHHRVGELVVESGADVLITVGRRARDIASAARHRGLPRGSIFPTRDVAQADEVLRAVLESEDMVLIKGSRSLGMERLAHSVA